MLHHYACTNIWRKNVRHLEPSYTEYLLMGYPSYWYCVYSKICGFGSLLRTFHKDCGVFAQITSMDKRHLPLWAL
jgi:hypothetical protein